MDNLLNWLDQRAKYKEDPRAIEIAYQNSNNAVRKIPHQPSWKQQNITHGMNPGNSTKQPTLRELVMQQTRINEDINKRLAINDNIFKDIHGKLEIFSSMVEKQHKFNKKIEDKLAQLVAALLVATNPKRVSAITTRGGKSTTALS
jgi:hypothetical protein